MKGIQEVFQNTVYLIHSLSDRIGMYTLKYAGIGIIVFFIFLILRNIFTKYILNFLIKINKRNKTNLNKKIIEAFREPLRGFFTVLGIYFAILCFGTGFLYNLDKWLTLKHLLKSAIIILITWGFYNLTTEHSVLYEELSNKYNFKLDKIVFPFLSKILRVIIIGICVSLILSEWGYNINGFVAGLGIGGLAIAFAAKDALANIFGGLVIILDKPFSIGDYIKTNNVEGVVEDINLRSTRIRAVDKGLVIEPNSILSNSTIINLTKRSTRRISLTIGLTYHTKVKNLQNCVKKIKDMLIENEDILNDGIAVNFDGFGESSLKIVIYCFTNTADWAKYLDIKENISYKIIDILDKEGVSIAFPSTSVYFETPLMNESDNK